MTAKPMTAMGVGMAFIWSPLAATATRNLPPELAGAGSGVYNATRQVGAVLGSAAIAVLMDSRIAAHGLVFHGGSGSLPEEISAAVDYGVVKMNIDTDTQYAFTRPVAGYMLTNYEGVLKVDGEVGNKKQYDPRAWGKEAEAAMAARIVEACEHLRAAGTHA